MNETLADMPQPVLLNYSTASEIVDLHRTGVIEWREMIVRLTDLFDGSTKSVAFMIRLSGI